MTVTASLAEGARVKVRDEWPERRGPVHIRTPHYVRGVEGRVVRRLGSFANPEDLAFGRPAARVPLYHVAFPAPAIWSDAAPGTSVLIEIFDHWLEPLP